MARKRILLVLFRLVVGGLFIYAGVLKVSDTLEFAQDIRNYRVVGQTLSFLAALALPWIEIVAGFCLIAGIMKRASALTISAMLAFFILLVVMTMVRGIDVDCGCFGALSRKADFRLIIEDGLMLAMALSVLFAQKPSRS